MKKYTYTFCTLFAVIATSFISIACGKVHNTEPDPPQLIQSSPVDSRWGLSLQLTYNDMFPWKTTGKCHATYGEGRGKAYFMAVSATGDKLSYSIEGSGPAVGGMKENDYLLFCVPMENLPAGTDIDFMVTLNATSQETARDWQFEYYEAGEWIPSGEPFIINSSYQNHASIVREYTLAQDIVQDTLKMRCRVCSSKNAKDEEIDTGKGGFIYFPPMDFQSCWIIAYDPARFPAAKDKSNIMALGNSFSYYYAPVWMLKEIARSQGHRMELRMNVKGAQTFGNHLTLPYSKAVIGKGGYDVAVLQDQSTQHSSYSKSPSSKANVREDTKRIKAEILENSPSCRILVENTWSYSASNYGGFGSYEAFDAALTNGCLIITEETSCEMSPICAAFAEARKQGFNLTISDNKHQNEYGAYLKACVNYLVIFKERFTSDVSDCNLPPNAAETLREIAEAIALGK